MDIAIPLGLRNAIESGSCVLFLGAGVGANAFDDQGNPAPDGRHLAEDIVQHFKITEATAPYNLAKVAQVAEQRTSRPQLNSFIKERFSNLTPDEHLRWLATIPWRAIFTTNYDLAILRAYELEADPAQQPVPISSTEELVHCDPRVQVPIYYLHGNIIGPSPHFIITQNDYAKFRNRRRMLFELLKQQFAQSTLLYIGYSNEDPNWQTVLEELLAEFSPNQPPQAYRLVLGSEPLDIEILKGRNIETMLGTLADFHRSALVALSGDITAHNTLEAFRAMFPRHFCQPLRKVRLQL